VTSKKGELTIRPGELRDVEVLVEFNQALARETEGKALATETVTRGVESLINNPQYGFYVLAELGGVAVGALMVTFEWSDWRDAVFWWIQSVYVRPEHRRRGIYRGLYEHLKARAKSQTEPPVCGFRLYTEKSNEVAQQVYEALGMQETRYLMYEDGG